MIKQFIVFFISFFFLANLVFIFLQVWKIVNIDESVIKESGESASGQVRRVEFPLEDDIEKINSTSLFGRYEEARGGRPRGYKVSEGEISTELIDNVPESRSAGKITGLLFSDNAKKSMVIVEHAGKQTGYGVGERIAGSNAVILRILKNKILLDENGYYGTLVLKE